MDENRYTHIPLLASPSVNNPYWTAFNLIKNRILWDIRLESRRSRRRLSDLKNRHHGKKAVILCNGPSLANADFSLLKNVYTFGLNKINLISERYNFKPDSIVSVNPYVITQNADFFKSTNTPLYLDSSGYSLIGKRSNVTYLHSTTTRRFSRDCSMSIDQGYTVTFVALQLAYHMGFTKVALIGCDHSFSTSGPSNALVRADAADPNHFDNRYFSNGMLWQLPDLMQSEISYLLAKETYETTGRSIVNCTDGGNLSIFNRQSLISFLADDDRKHVF